MCVLNGSKCRGIYKLFVIIPIIIIVYWFILSSLAGKRALYVDPMNRIVFNTDIFENCCSWWPISHFFLFLFIGLTSPDCDVIAMSGGIVWELFEVGVHSLAGYDRQGVRREVGNLEYSKNWWAGSSKDIAFNFMGFYLGKIITIIRGGPIRGFGLAETKN